MSNSSFGPALSPVSAASPVSPASGRKFRGVWRVCLSWLSRLWLAYRHAREARITQAELRGLSADTLRDIGLPQEVLNEIGALQEFERGRSAGFSQYW